MFLVQENYFLFHCELDLSKRRKKIWWKLYPIDITQELTPPTVADKKVKQNRNIVGKIEKKSHNLHHSSSGTKTSALRSTLPVQEMYKRHMIENVTRIQHQVWSLQNVVGFFSFRGLLLFSHVICSYFVFRHSNLVLFLLPSRLDFYLFHPRLITTKEARFRFLEILFMKLFLLYAAGLCTWAE